MRCVGPILLLAMALPWTCASSRQQAVGADARQAAPLAPASAAQDAPPATGAGQAEADAAPVRVPRPHVRRAPGQGIDETVHRLAKGLGLDEGQQKKLREILTDEQQQVWRLRRNPGAGVDWAGASATIISQTKSRIRAMLNDEQRQKYETDVPRDQTAPAQADLQHWMQLQESKRQQDGGTTR